MRIFHSSTSDSIHLRQCIVWALLPLLLIANTSALAWWWNSEEWVLGSWVNVRSRPSADAEIITHFSANTKVERLGEYGEWCMVRSAEQDVTGFMICKLLGDKPLTLQQVGEKTLTNGKPNPDYSPLRAFWVAPSLFRLREAGEFYWKTMLSEEEKAKEVSDKFFKHENGPQPYRFPIAEFDAMKLLMAQGVVADKETRPAIVPLPALDVDLTQVKSESIIIDGMWFGTKYIEFIQQNRPVAVQPSYFKSLEDLAPASSSVEQLSAQFGLREKLAIKSGPKWVYVRREGSRVVGFWDMGSTESSLEQPVIEYVIGRRGLAAAYEWQARELDDIDGYCTLGFALSPRATKRLPDYPKIKDKLVWFYTPMALPMKKVEIKTYARRMEQKTERSHDFGHNFDLLVMHEIDLNSDAIADLTVWEMSGKTLLDEIDKDVVQRMVFVNIDGTWHLLDSDSYGECT